MKASEIVHDVRSDCEMGKYEFWRRFFSEHRDFKQYLFLEYRGMRFKIEDVISLNHAVQYTGKHNDIFFFLWDKYRD